MFNVPLNDLCFMYLRDGDFKINVGTLGDDFLFTTNDQHVFDTCCVGFSHKAKSSVEQSHEWFCQLYTHILEDRSVSRFGLCVFMCGMFKSVLLR